MRACIWFLGCWLAGLSLAGAAPTVTFTATSPVNPGSSSTLTWTVSGASSCTASMVTGTDATWSGSVSPTGGTQSSAVFSVQRRTYRLSCTDGTPTVVDVPVYGGYRVALHGTNPHYVRGMDGSATVLMGYNSNGWKHPSSALDLMTGKINYLRAVFASLTYSYEPLTYRAGLPYTTTGTAPNQVMNFDSENATFWTNLHEFLVNTYDRGIYVGLETWDGHYSLPGGGGGSAQSVWQSAHNTQGVQWAYDLTSLNAFPSPSCSGATSGERLVCRQRRWVDRMMTEVKVYPHVFLETNNEDTGSDAWLAWWADYFAAQGFLVIVTQAGSGGVSDSEVSSNADMHAICYHHRDSTWINSTRLGWQKLICVDADDSAADGARATMRGLAWSSLARGGHWDDYTEDDPWPTLTNHLEKLGDYGRLLSFLSSNQIPLASLVPNQTISAGNCLTAGSGALCLWQAGQRYLIYTSVNVTVNLTAASGTLNYLWYNPTGGACTSCTGTVAGGSNQALTKPTNNSDMVLWISPQDTLAPNAPTSLRVVQP